MLHTAKHDAPRLKSLFVVVLLKPVINITWRLYILGNQVPLDVRLIRRVEDLHDLRQKVLEHDLPFQMKLLVGANIESGIHRLRETYRVYSTYIDA